MLDLNLPPGPARLAAACFVTGISPPQLMSASSEYCAEFAADAGMAFSEFLAAMDWLCTFYETHPPHRALTN